MKKYFGLREARRRPKKKTVTICPLKTENPLISRVSYLRNGLKNTGHVLREASSCERVTRESQNSLCKIIKKLKIASSFLQVGSYSRLTYENASEGVFQQKKIGLFGKTLNTKMLHKNTFKNI